MDILLGVLISCFTVFVVNAAAAETRTAIAEPDVFRTTLDAAVPGMVLELAGGAYGAILVRGVAGTPEQPIVVRSADPAHPAEFSGLSLHEAENLVFEGVVLNYTFKSGDPPQAQPFRIVGSRNITFRDVVFDGDVAQGVSEADDGFPTGFGLGIMDSAQVTVEDCTFRDFLRGLVVGRSSDIVLRGNDLHSLRSDGMNFAQVEHVVIEGNHIHDFRRSLTSADHPDMIQFWTNGTTEPTRDITIRDNVLNSGNGTGTQSIFMRNDQVDRGLAGYELYYRNILIAGNVIINAHLAGISIGATDGLVISNNTLIRNAHSAAGIKNAKMTVPGISTASVSRNVQIVRNVTNAIGGYEKQPDWVFADNFYIQDLGRRGKGVFYDLAFVDARTGNPQDLGSFSYLPGGPLDGKGLGAARLASLHPVVPGGAPDAAQ
jgi:hypothetical protein